MKIVVFHFAPLELFPPIMNMLSFLSNNLPESYTVTVYSTYSEKQVTLFKSNNDRIKIKRFGHFNPFKNVVARLNLYFNYNVRSFLHALLKNSNKIIYYETSSAIPPFLFKKLKPSAPLYIHYHEYMTPEEYNNIGLLKKLHALEKKLYPKAAWISHTNENRLNFFKKDVGILNENILHAMPNYPSRSWVDAPVAKNTFSTPVRIVYVGAIGFDELYIKEFAQWIEDQGGKAIWDIYSQQDDNDLRSFLKDIDSKYIHVKGFVSYEALPSILNKYDVGVILYKGLTHNFIYNAPNKLFEYLACGLDVWFPEELKGAHPYTRTNVYPKVIRVDFKNPAGLMLEQLANRNGLSYSPTNFYCEEQYERLRSLLIK